MESLRKQLTDQEFEQLMLLLYSNRITQDPELTQDQKDFLILNMDAEVVSASYNNLYKLLLQCLLESQEEKEVGKTQQQQ